MSDITDLFSHIAPDAGADPSPDTVSADLARGRIALRRDHRRRTIRRSLTGGVAVIVAAGVFVGIDQAHGDHPQHQADVAGTHQQHVPPTSPPRATRPTPHAVRLVDYSGAQLAGFTVDRVPDGWRLSTSTPDALLIDANATTNNDPDDFAGKLAVLTTSRDEHGLPSGGTAVTVNGQPGVITDQGRYGVMLTYDTSSLGITIQAPSALHWTNDQLVSFAAGVHETGDAVAGRG